MAILLALVSALAYGLSDFIGGLVARRTSAWSVAVVGSLTAAVSTTVLAALVPGDPGWSDLAWAVLAGLGSGAGAGASTRSALRAVGVSLLIELTAAILAACAWVAGVVVT